MTLNDLERRNSHFSPNLIALLANYITVVEKHWNPFSENPAPQCGSL